MLFTHIDVDVVMNIKHLDFTDIAKRTPQLRKFFFFSTFSFGCFLD